MGMSNRHWNPPLKLEDFEFENDRLVKIRGMQPMYMDGYKLIAAVEACALILRDIVKLKDLTPIDDFDSPKIGPGLVNAVKGRREANEDFRLPPRDADVSGPSVPESSTDKDSDGW